jgi:hypothetical protein
MVAIGDVHGEYEKFRGILLDAKLMDSSDNRIGGDTIFVQTGDMIDRGPKSIESVDLIRSLQEGAQKAGGRVVRLFGSHELMLLEGDHRYVNFEKPSELAGQFREEIVNGKLRAAWTDGIRLFSHAGVRTKLRQWLENGIMEADNRQFTPERLRRIADTANQRLREAVAEGSYQGPLFYIDKSRGGSDPYGGLFWGDAENLIGSEQAFEMSQVFGHTPTGKPALEVEYVGSLINIDCGMYSGYGGNCGYLEITPEGELIEDTKGVKSQEFKPKPLRGLE